MSDRFGEISLIRLMTWLSPAFPIGGFAYSGGLEKAVEDGLVGDAAALRLWAETLMAHGSGWNDALLLAESHHAARDPLRLAAAAELAEALAGSRERHQETMALGDAFLSAAQLWLTPEPEPGTETKTEPGQAALPMKMAYPVAVGAVAGRLAIPLGLCLSAYLHANLSQIVSAGIRLQVLGQRQGVALLAETEGLLLKLAARAEASGLEALGSAAVQAEIAGLRHETQTTRLFRS